MPASEEENLSSNWSGKSEIPPPDIRQISAGGRKDLLRFLSNENRAQGSKDLTKQQGLPSKYFLIIIIKIIIIVVII